MSTYFRQDEDRHNNDRNRDNDNQKALHMS